MATNTRNKNQQPDLTTEAHTEKRNQRISEMEEEEHALRMACIRNESAARIAALTAAPIASASAVKPTDEEDTGEIPQEVQKCTLFAGLPQEEIAKIFLNKFKPINLYRLRHMQGVHYDSYKERDHMTLDGGVLRLRKTSGSLKDYGSTFYEVWQESFHNYITIMTYFFGKGNPDLNPAISNFYDQIGQLAKVYEWQEAVLPLAIQMHTHILTQQSTDPSNWVILPAFQHRFCNPLVVLSGPGNKRKRGQSPSFGSKKSRDSSNNASITCNNFNLAHGCNWSECLRAHKCSRCGGTTHGQVTCPKKA